MCHHELKWQISNHILPGGPAAAEQLPLRIVMLMYNKTLVTGVVVWIVRMVDIAFDVTNAS